MIRPRRRRRRLRVEGACLCHTRPRPSAAASGTSKMTCVPAMFSFGLRRYGDVDRRRVRQRPRLAAEVEGRSGTGGSSNVFGLGPLTNRPAKPERVGRKSTKGTRCARGWFGFLFLPFLFLFLSLFSVFITPY